MRTLLAALLLAPTSASAPLTVNTTGGAVEGYVKGSVRYFDGIPYAAPPVGDLRWRPPQSLALWQGVRAAKTLPPFCQHGKVGSEDCLYLNVVTPNELPTKPMPVQFWIHGGGLKTGGSRQPLYRGNHVVEYTGAAMGEPVMIVTINYRLDMYAEMVQRDLVEEQKGGPLNYGLQDMCFAMQWVQDNIAAFGGDPERVMLYGESGGGVAVTLHLFADSKVTGCGKFAAAVGESVCNALVTKQPDDTKLMPYNLQTGDNFTAALGCTGKGVDCLRKATPDQIAAASGGVNFDIVVDGVFMPDWPGKLLNEGRFHNVPVIMGSNTNEGQLFASRWPNANPKTVEELKASIAPDFSYLDDSEVTRIVNYYADRFAGETYQLALTQYINDMIEKCTNLAVTSAYATAGIPSFMYEFGYSYNDGSRSGVASHGAELSFVWGDTHSALDTGVFPFPPKVFTAREQRLANQTMAYWASFATTGNPNAASPPPGSVHWPAVASGAGAFNSSMGLDIDDKHGVLPSTLDGCVLLGELGVFPTIYQSSAALALV